MSHSQAQIKDVLTAHAIEWFFQAEYNRLLALETFTIRQVDGCIVGGERWVDTSEWMHDDLVKFLNH